MRARLPLLVLMLLCGCNKVEGTIPGQCIDGEDNDNDDRIDCEDPDCADMTSCADPLRMDPDDEPDDTEDSAWYDTWWWDTGWYDTGWWNDTGYWWDTGYYDTGWWVWPDTGIEEWSMEGHADIDLVNMTYDGTTRMSDVVVNNGAGNYAVGDILCEYVWDTTEDVVTPAPTMDCLDCEFAFNLDTQPNPTIVEASSMCAMWYGAASTEIQAGTFWDRTIGHNPDYYGMGPALMYYVPGYSGYYGTFDGYWIAMPYPYATTEVDTSEGTWDWWVRFGLYAYY